MPQKLPSLFVKLSNPSDFFSTVMGHFDIVASHTKGGFRNMHIRHSRKSGSGPQRKQVFSFANVMKDNGNGDIDGMAAGPGFFVTYTITPVGVVNESLSFTNTETANYFFSNFEKMVRKRVTSEQKNYANPPKSLKMNRTVGSFYLQRCKGGSLSPDYALAVQKGIFDISFVNELSSFDMMLSQKKDKW